MRARPTSTTSLTRTTTTHSSRRTMTRLPSLSPLSRPRPKTRPPSFPLIRRPFPLLLNKNKRLPSLPTPHPPARAAILSHSLPRLCAPLRRLRARWRARRPSRMSSGGRISLRRLLMSRRVCGVSSRNRWERTLAPSQCRSPLTSRSACFRGESIRGLSNTNFTSFEPDSMY